MDAGFTLDVYPTLVSKLAILYFHGGGPNHIETTPSIYSSNQWTGFYVIGTFVMKELKAAKITTVSCRKLSQFALKLAFLKRCLSHESFQEKKCIYLKKY